MVTIHEMSAEITASNGNEYKLTVEPAWHPELSGCKFAGFVENLHTGEKKEDILLDTETLAEALWELIREYD